MAPGAPTPSDISRARRQQRRATQPTQADLDLLDDQSFLGIEIRFSSIPGAGQGAFATRELAMHTVLGQYKGEVLTLTEVAARYPDGASRAYLMDVGSGRWHDCIDPAQSNWLRYINSPHNTGRAPNARLEINGVIKTVQRVLPGQELLYSYGRTYSFA